ncbi:MAG: hypothetical protein AMXMBFR7_22870 [Planctomycetota bacterium]
MGITKILGVALLVGSGVLGYIAYDKYQEHNRGAEAVNKSVLGDMGLQVKKEVPKETWYFGAGGAVCLVLGLGAMLKK